VEEYVQRNVERARDVALLEVLPLTDVDHAYLLFRTAFPPDLRGGDHRVIPWSQEEVGEELAGFGVALRSACSRGGPLREAPNAKPNAPRRRRACACGHLLLVKRSGCRGRLEALATVVHQANLERPSRLASSAKVMNGSSLSAG